MKHLGLIYNIAFEPSMISPPPPMVDGFRLSRDEVMQFHHRHSVVIYIRGYNSIFGVDFCNIRATKSSILTCSDKTRSTG